MKENFLAAQLKTCSMNCEIIPTPDFEKALKRLSKKYKSLKDDLKDFYDSLLENPFQGTELFPGVRKIRMAITSKGKGKSGGARVITYSILVTEIDHEIYLLDLYDKSSASTIDEKLLKKRIKEEGLPGCEA